MPGLTESVVESAALAWLERLGWTVKHGPEIAPGELAAERADYGQVVLTQRLQDALARLNPTLPTETLADAFRKLTRPEGPTLEARNRALHRLLVDGVTVEYRTVDGAIRGAQAWVLDFEEPGHNDWLAVTQFTISEHQHTRRPDVVLFVNGLPLALIELKNAADEAHRSQYDFIDGFARHMRDASPNASFIGFTGTPIETTDANTRAVFGDYISVYDIQRAVQDRATVPIYYESRLAKLALEEAERPTIDPDFEEATEGEEVERKEKLKSKWAQLEAIVGSEKRLKLIAADIVEHFDKRLEAMDGKAMVVCMSRRVCVELYRAIVALRPDWHDADDDRGAIKVVMTGSATDPPDWQPHIRNKPRREALANRFCDANDPFRIVLVRDMWLTGFDAPSLHTMYVDKPMRGHGLMQAIARVNRVFGDKPGGLVVDYLGLAHELKQALATYTESGGMGRTALDQGEAVAVMLEKYEICCGLFHGFDRSAWVTGTPAERLGLLPLAQEHILAQEDGKNRLLHAVQELSQAFALAVPHDEALRIRDDVAFNQAVRAGLMKRAPGEARTQEELDLAVRQIVSRAIASEGMVDIFAAAGLKKPDISILSDEFLAEVQGMPQRNLAVELLRKLLSGEIHTRRRTNVVQAHSFAEMLEASIRRYQNRAIEAAQVIEELIGLARDMRAANARGEALGLSDDELAF